MQVCWKSTNWFRRYSAAKAHFYSLYSVVNLKIRTRSTKSNQSFWLSQWYNIKFDQKTAFGSRDRVHISFFGKKLTFKVLEWPWKSGEGHQNLIISFPCLSFVSMQVFKNSPIGSGDRVQTRLVFTVFTVWWPWKLSQGHQILISSFIHPNNSIHKGWSESIIYFKR